MIENKVFLSSFVFCSRFVVSRHTEENKCANCVHISLSLRACRNVIAYEQDRVPFMVVIYFDLFMSSK